MTYLDAPVRGGAEDVFDSVFGVSEQYGGVVAVEEWVGDGGSRSQLTRRSSRTLVDARRRGPEPAHGVGWLREARARAVRRELGARDIKFRLYGIPGQEQHGIDLAGRDPEGAYVVVQCKEYEVFRSSDLRASVTTFARGRRPFDSRSFLVVTSASTNATQLTEELAALPDEHSYFELDLGGAEVINEHLRELRRHRHALYTRETAATFCSGASYPGFPAPPLDRQEQAERIQVGPLNTSDVAPILREAEARRNEPATAARLYGEVAERLRSAGFRGHALVLRQRPAGTSTSSDVSGATGSRGSRGSGFPFPRLRRAGSLSGGGPLGARPRAARPRGRRDRRPGQPGDRHPRRGRRRQLRRRSRHHPVHRHARRALPGRRDGDHALGPRRGPRRRLAATADRPAAGLGHPQCPVAKTCAFSVSLQPLEPVELHGRQGCGTARPGAVHAPGPKFKSMFNRAGLRVLGTTDAVRRSDKPITSLPASRPVLGVAVLTNTTMGGQRAARHPQAGRLPGRASRKPNDNLGSATDSHHRSGASPTAEPDSSNLPALHTLDRRQLLPTLYRKGKAHWTRDEGDQVLLASRINSSTSVCWLPSMAVMTASCSRTWAASGWAKMVRIAAATISALPFGTTPRTLCMRCTRQRGQEAPRSTALIAVLRPVWASKVTNWVPPNPRAFSERRKAVRNVPSSEAPTASILVATRRVLNGRVRPGKDEGLMPVVAANEIRRGAVLAADLDDLRRLIGDTHGPAVYVQPVTNVCLHVLLHPRVALSVHPPGHGWKPSNVQTAETLGCAPRSGGL
jgi:hypothetical protein